MVGLLNRHPISFSIGNESVRERLELENKVHDCDLWLSDQLSAMTGFCLEGGKNL